MLSDHIWDSILARFSFLNLIGRIAFPIFAFQAVQGYLHTKNLKAHLLKLFLFACIAQIPFMLFLSTFTTSIFVLNIFFTFLLGMFALFLYDKTKYKIVGFLLVILVSIVGEFLPVDYGAFGILLLFCFYFFRNKKIPMTICTILLCFAKYVPNFLMTPSLFSHYLFCAIFTCCSLLFILAYNQKEGPKAKYFFYIFYPLHLFLLFLFHLVLYS